MERHGGEELLAESLDGGFADGGGRSGGVEAEEGVAHEGGELGVVRGADVDVREGVGGVEELGWDAEVRDGLPDEEGLAERGIERFEGAEDRGSELGAAAGGADEVEGFGEEERGGEGGSIQAYFGGCVFEGAVLVRAVVVPAAGGEARGVVADEAGSLPGLNLRGDRRGEVRTDVDHP